jgi:hypothetical protein
MTRRPLSLAVRRKLAIFLSKVQSSQLKKYGRLKMSFYENFDFFKESRIVDSNLGIIFQGPVRDMKSLEYLENSINQLSKLILPDNIVVSSWKEDLQRLRKLESKCRLVISDEQMFKNNHFKQLYSTHVGLQQFSDNGIDFVFKVRVDQCFNWKLLILFMPQLLQEFGTHRIVFMSNNSFKYRLFGLSDMFTFGAIDEMRSFWNFEEMNDQELKLAPDFALWFDQESPMWSESWLNLRYAINQNFIFSESAWEDFIRYIEKRVIVADSRYFGHEWLKLDTNFEGSIEKMLFNEHSAKKIQEWSFMDWFGIYRGIRVSEIEVQDIL